MGEVTDAVGRVAGAASHTGLAGVSAQLADARFGLHLVSPAGQWDQVLAEVRRVQAERSTTLLGAMHVVYARLCAGWAPVPGGD